MIAFIRWLTVVLACQLFVGCASGGSAGVGTFTEFQLSENLTLVVRELDAGEDSYRVIVGFKENTDHKNVIQEVKAKNSRGNSYAIVESFETTRPMFARTVEGVEASEWDIHSATGVSGWEHRSMDIYAADVVDVQSNPLGFAILPANQDGSFKTELPTYVNEHHQKKYSIAGEIETMHPEKGSYEIFWVPNKVVLMTPEGGIVFEKGKGHRLID